MGAPRAGLAAPLSAMSAARPAAGLMATSRLSMAAPQVATSGLSMAAPRAGLMATSRLSMAAPQVAASRLSMAAPRAGLMATSRLSMGMPRGVDLSLDQFNLSAAAEPGSWAGTLEAPEDARELSIKGDAFWAALKSETA